MPDKSRLRAQVENAAEYITPVWPLKNFIATNPLAGFEGEAFDKAIAKGQNMFGGRGVPDRRMGQMALAQGKIKDDVLRDVLRAHGKNDLYDSMVTGDVVDSCAHKKDAKGMLSSPLNAMMIKYLSAFLDEGQAAWSMPYREEGFYKSWRRLITHDAQVLDKSLLPNLPDEAIDALLMMLTDVADEEREALMTQHLAMLAGWSGFVKWRARQKHYDWQAVYPITMLDMLAVRLCLVKLMNDDGLRAADKTSYEADRAEGLLWLEAWEESYRTELMEQLLEAQSVAAPRTSQDASQARADAQFVFCIDVRSEVFRRHLEAAGAYETIGFAGFFGVAIRHTPYGEDVGADSCPVLLQPQFQTTDLPRCGHEKAGEKHVHGLKTMAGWRGVLKRLKNDIAAPFAMVEAAGAFFSLGLLGRTLSPAGARCFMQGVTNKMVPKVELEAVVAKQEGHNFGLSLAERVFHAEAALKIMGLTDCFAPLVVLTGHGSETVNNPYAAGLDCGACGGNHGGPNARVMATVFNDEEVRAQLKERDIHIPDDTVFIGAQHNTTTDELELFEPPKGAIQPDVWGKLKIDLNTARLGAVAERQKRFSTISSPSVRAADWAELRPEWGLARNAAFIVGARELTKNIDLEGRSFLHSYNWEDDHDGKALEVILTAPMVVAEWINTQYYFSTVDNHVYGSGSKITHNVVGKIGVMQGNASDLMTGLPLQSVMSADGHFYHEPLRLFTVVHAPLARVTGLIEAHDVLQRLFNNGWVALMVIDPETGKNHRYEGHGAWCVA